MTETTTPTSPLELIALLGRHMGTRAWYAEQEREMANLRKVYALCRANDIRWIDFLKLWASEAASPAAKRSVLIILAQVPEQECLAYWQKMDRDEVAEVMTERELRDAETRPSRRTSGQRVTEDGMYRNPATDQIFKVQWNLKRTGLYAKQLVMSETGDPKSPWHAEFVFDRNAISKLAPEMKMTLEDAKAFGALYGTCCNCGRTLTNEESIAAGIGPICAGKF